MTNKYGVKFTFNADNKFLINYSTSEEERDKTFEKVKDADWSATLILNSLSNPMIINLTNVLYCEKVDG